jgi:deazaflavin-dependent oxidoreductase (nitroreductase family)
MEVPPKGTRGAGMPSLPRPLMNLARGLMLWLGRRSGEGTVILTTVGARSGRPHAVAVGRFPEGKDAFLIVASNMGSARHPAWYINMAKNPNQVWAEVGKRKFKVRPQLLKGAEREAAFERVIAKSPGYAAYRQRTDREIPIVRLVPEG